MLIVASKVKEMAKMMDCNTGGDAIEGLNEFATWVVGEACSKAQANGRKTVRSYDFVSSETNEPGATLAVASKVREAIKAAGMNCGGDALDGLNAYLGWLVAVGCNRAKQNGRKTLRRHDIL